MSPSRRHGARSVGAPASWGAHGGASDGRGAPGGASAGRGPAQGRGGGRPTAGSRRPADREDAPAHGDGPSPRRRGDRLDAAVTEQRGRCFWCRRPFSALVPPTTDHVVPRVKGGPSWRENEVAACRRCNGQRGHLGPVDWLEECLRRGWPTEPDELAATLERLDAAIAQRGGQRRARPYLDSQRRRLGHGVG